MVNQNDFNSVILSLIYKISSLKTEEELIDKATPDILKKFNYLTICELTVNVYHKT